MSKWTRWLCPCAALPLLLLPLAGCSSTQASAKAPQAALSTTGPQVVHVIGKKASWELDKTVVKKGRPVRLIVQAAEGMHSLSIPGTSVQDVHVMDDDAETVTFTPQKAGVLTLVCTYPCGSGHAEMRATLQVID